MRTRLRFIAAGVLLVVCLSGCVPAPDGMLTSTPTPSINLETRQRMATDCMDFWLNTEAPQDIIEDGMSVTDDSGATAVIQDSSGMYHIQFGTGAFAAWAGTGDNPWSVIFVAISNGLGCPYDPAVKVKIAQAEQECLTLWVNGDPPQAAIDAGLATTGVDGGPVQPVLTRDSSGGYHVDTSVDGFQDWVTSRDYVVPWNTIVFVSTDGDPCPYGLSSPTATPS